MLHLLFIGVCALNSDSWSRRSAIRVAGAVGTAAAVAVAPGHAAPTPALAPPAAPLPPLPKLGTVWGATDGLNGDDFVAFDESAYKAMADDARRTPLFEEAIRRRLRGKEGQLIVLDIGTGPFALLALMAARAGAKRVYAVEANAEAARRARTAISRARDVPAGTIEVLEGFSSDVSLPGGIKADLVLAEIVGSVASEEGLLATLRDAQVRLVRAPHDPASYIPYACQTIVAPACYALHYSLGPPRFDWDKLRAPVRLNCRDETLQLLADPQVLESVTLSSAHLPPAGRWLPAGAAGLEFYFEPGRMQAAEAAFTAELRRERAPEEEAARMAAAVSRSLSAVAMWPRLILDEQGELVVECARPQPHGN